MFSSALSGELRPMDRSKSVAKQCPLFSFGGCNGLHVFCNGFSVDGAWIGCGGGDALGVSIPRVRKSKGGALYVLLAYCKAPPLRMAAWSRCRENQIWMGMGWFVDVLVRGGGGICVYNALNIERKTIPKKILRSSKAKPSSAVGIIG